MPFTKGHSKTGGRQKGSPNKRTVELTELLEKKGFNPAEKLVYVYRKAIKEYKRADQIADAIQKDLLSRGIPADKVNHGPSYLKIASDAAKELMQYVYPKRKAVEFSGPNGEPVPTVSVDLSGLTTEELKAVRKVIGEKGRTSSNG